MFMLGVAIIIDAILEHNADLGLVITGLVLLGIVPIDRAVSLLLRGHAPNGASSGSL